jgi:RimJ/RimL family protein N-acetyltransferase
MGWLIKMELKLRKLAHDDIIFMKEYFEDSEIKNQFLFTQKKFDSDLIKKFIDKSYSKKTINLAIEFYGEYAGTISLKNLDFDNLNAEYSIIIRKKFWGKGVASRATRLIINYGFETLRLKKIYLNVLSSNKRAIKFYLKMGFKYEGIFKKHFRIQNNYSDINWYAIFNHEEE